MSKPTTADRLAVLWAHREEIFAGEEPARTERLITVLAYIMARYPDEAVPPGFALRKRRLSPTANAEDRERHAALVRIARPILDGAARPDAPVPGRVAFLKLTDDDTPVDLPEGARAFWTQDRPPAYIFKSRSDDSRIGLFEAPETGAGDGPRIATYLAEPVTEAKAPAVSVWAHRIGAFAVLLGAVLLCYTIASTINNGAVIAKAHEAVEIAKTEDRDGDLAGKVADLCKNNPSETYGGLCQKGAPAADLQDGTDGRTRFAACLPQIAPSEASGTPAPLDRACLKIWHTALAEQEDTLPSWDLLSGVPSDGASLSLVRFFNSTVLALVLVFIGIGLYNTGRAAGALISQEYRISLSRFQIAAWSVILLSALAVFAAFNVGVMAATWLDHSAAEGSAFPALEDTLIPDLQAWTWAVLGITIASPAASALVKAFAPSDREFFDTLERQEGKETQGVHLAPLEQRQSPMDARFSDLFVGETIWNTDNVDLTRAQMLVITLLLLLLYTAWLITSLGAIGHAQIVAAFPEAKAILSDFPNPGAVFASLLALTHGGYIAGKWQFGEPQSARGTAGSG